MERHVGGLTGGQCTRGWHAGKSAVRSVERQSLLVFWIPPKGCPSDTKRLVHGLLSEGVLRIAEAQVSFEMQRAARGTRSAADMVGSLSSRWTGKEGV